MSDHPPRGKDDPEDLLESVLGYGQDDPADDLPPLTVAEQEALILAAGGNPDAIRAQARADVEKLLGPPAHPPAQAMPADPPAGPGPGVPGIAVVGAVVVAGAIVAGVLWSSKHGEKLPAEVPHEDASATNDAALIDAHEDVKIRHEDVRLLIATATDKYARKEWEACLADLAKAEAIDPSSVTTPAVSAMKQAAILASAKNKGPK